CAARPPPVSGPISPWPSIATRIVLRDALAGRGPRGRGDAASECRMAAEEEPRALGEVWAVHRATPSSTTDSERSRHLPHEPPLGRPQPERLPEHDARGEQDGTGDAVRAGPEQDR